MAVKTDTYSAKELKRIEPFVQKTEALQAKMRTLTDEELKSFTSMLRIKIKFGNDLNNILPEAFAVVREASKRVLGMEPFHVQIIGATLLHQGRIAEMRTGEGKTLTAAMPVFLNALDGKGVHVVTVNDYLAKRDAENIGKLYEFMGLSVGCIQHEMTTAERKKQYACDITYVTNTELGFDYLRDNMAVSKDGIVLRGLHYALIDEVDSILIDEARTPLIISEQNNKSSQIYEKCDALARKLKRGDDVKEFSKINAILGIEEKETGDFAVDEKNKTIVLTSRGIRKIESFFSIKNFSDPCNLEIQHGIILALKAHYLMKKDRDYIIRKDRVVIVDEFTGRLMPSRRYSDGLHQAIEAKEGLEIKKEAKTLATITFQSFFNKYEKKCGMSGTALAEQNEFREIYGMDVVVVPTNKPVIRKDYEDTVYKTKKEKYTAIVRDIIRTHKNGQPVLVGTTSVEISEFISEILKKRQIKHNVLNAKNHAKEAEIIANAGRYGAVTIATNMAGRGTDIKLDKRSLKAGGLRVIGTERHESRRIDDQLRGRSGRQGDPGESIFYVSLEDDLMRLFGSEKILSMYNAMGVKDGENIADKTLSKAIESAQHKIDENNFSARKTLMEYDEATDEQREAIYRERRKILELDDVRPTVKNMIKKYVREAVRECYLDGECDYEKLNNILLPYVPTWPLSENIVAGKDRKEISIMLQKEALNLYQCDCNGIISDKDMRIVEKYTLLKCIDMHWVSHLEDMSLLKQVIGFQAYGQKNPRIEYRNTGRDMFNEMIDDIESDSVKNLFKIKSTCLTTSQTAKIRSQQDDDYAWNFIRKVHDLED